MVVVLGVVASLLAVVLGVLVAFVVVLIGLVIEVAGFGVVVQVERSSDFVCSSPSFINAGQTEENSSIYISAVFNHFK